MLKSIGDKIWYAAMYRKHRQCDGISLLRDCKLSSKPYIVVHSHTALLLTGLSIAIMDLHYPIVPNMYAHALEKGFNLHTIWYDYMHTAHFIRTMLY